MIKLTLCIVHYKLDLFTCIIIELYNTRNIYDMDNGHVFSDTKSAMISIRHLVSKGYVFYTSGTCKQRDFRKLSLKFTDRYDVTRTPRQRSYAAEKGHANVLMVWLTGQDANTMMFWLLATKGDNLIYEMEDMKDTRLKSERLSVLNGEYILLKEPRRGDIPRWTWKMSEEYYNQWKDNICLAIRHRKEMTIKQLHFSLMRIYGFSAARKQGFALLRFFNNEWERSRKEPFPFKGSYIGYLTLTNKKRNNQ